MSALPLPVLLKATSLVFRSALCSTQNGAKHELKTFGFAPSSVHRISDPGIRDILVIEFGGK